MNLEYGIRRTIKEIPERLQPREQFDQLGPENLSDDVLLALLLRTGLPGQNVLELARDLMDACGSIQQLARMPITELNRVPGIGRVKAQVLLAALELARRLNDEQGSVGAPVQTPEQAASLMAPRARGLEHEVFWVLLLDVRNHLKRQPLEISRGILDASLVHPREVFRDAVRHSAATVVLAHNHPSGDVSPSSEDLRITRQLIEAGKIMDIRVLDHVIVSSLPASGRPSYMSLREQGLVQFGDD